MAYYKDTSNKLHWLDSSEFEYLLPAGSVQITDAEAAAIQEANKPVPAPVTQISPRQIRMALTQLGLRNDVEAAVAAGDQRRAEQRAGHAADHGADHWPPRNRHAPAVADLDEPDRRRPGG